MKPLLGALALTALFAGCSASNTSTDVSGDAPQAFDYSASLQEIGVTAQERAEMDALLQSFIDDRKTSSLAAFLAKDGKVVYADAFGWKDIESQERASLDDYYVGYWEFLTILSRETLCETR